MTDTFVSILTQVVKRGQYVKEEMIEKLHLLWVQKLLNDEDLQTLTTLAEQSADPNYQEIKTTGERLTALESESVNTMLALVELYEMISK